MADQRQIDRGRQPDRGAAMIDQPLAAFHLLRLPRCDDRRGCASCTLRTHMSKLQEVSRKLSRREPIQPRPYSRSTFVSDCPTRILGQSCRVPRRRQLSSRRRAARPAPRRLGQARVLAARLPGGQHRRHLQRGARRLAGTIYQSLPQQARRAHRAPRPRRSQRQRRHGPGQSPGRWWCRAEPRCRSEADRRVLPAALQRDAQSASSPTTPTPFWLLLRDACGLDGVVWLARHRQDRRA